MRRLLVLTALASLVACNGRDVQDITGVTRTVPTPATVVTVGGETVYHVNFTSSVTGEIPAGSASFGAELLNPPHAPIEGTVVVARDGVGGISFSEFDGCTSLTNAADVAGKIALIERGSCTFAIKAQNAENAGAIAVIIYDNVTTARPFRMGGGGDASVTIPAILITRTMGRLLAVAPGTVGRIEAVSGPGPALVLPDNIVVGSVSPSGANVIFSVTASTFLGVEPAQCTKNSGALFPIGVTTVRCGVTDISGNNVQGEFTVTVIDDAAEAPVLTLPDPITVNATSPAGALVSYAFQATDNVGVRASGCEPGFQTVFPIGTTTVNCFASDGGGNVTRGSFTVTVKGAADQVSDLSTGVVDYDFPDGTETSLLAKLSAANQALAANDIGTACSTLSAFINQVNAQSGKKIPTATALALINEANRIRAVAGC